ncbi:alpha/beta fold hydrolase [Blastococcus haudaquaticus]|uniref:Pimeloyl-ACP methyl ester carboxylesterase n=1 Tax=Blastococcus haudaquaticus TaxID=1938745 RepID=A0A286GSH5_9ACTN|nr:alpha/beta hydrolase [Blastococcus haudaquaticus]SOD98422.1 Pimeloyl-ACP methyl ester carboxylesterase [Blastococcus haudaquaticus]
MTDVRSTLHEPRRGAFPNGMEYLTWGDGPRTLLSVLGGPGSFVPTGTMARMLVRQARPYVAAGYTVWIVTRRRDMPDGHGIADMAGDYAQVVAEQFGGRVDLVVGESYGGMVAQYLAALHPERLGHLALVVSGCEVSAWGKDVDARLGAALARGDVGASGTAFAEYLLPGDRLRLPRRLLGPLIGRVLFADEVCPPGDVLVEVEAELAFDSRAVLPAVRVPVLMVSGSRDRFFPPDVVEETAALIPDCTVVRYRGKGHLGTGTDKRVAADVLAFVDRP